MRHKFPFIILLTLFCCEISFSQNYTQFRVETNEQDWILYDVTNTNDWTILDLRVYIKSNKSYALYVKSNTYLSGGWGEPLYALHVRINERDWTFDKSYIFGERNKGKYVPVKIWFRRVPCGVSSFTYCESGFITWNNIPLPNNPNTEHSYWTNSTLRSHWEQNGMTKIEGVYDFMGTNDRNWWGNSHHSLGIIKVTDGYDIIYLGGSAYDGAWQEGDIKGHFVATSVSGLFKSTKWLMESKIPSKKPFYMNFDKNGMCFYETDQAIKADFLKVYPTTEDAIMEETTEGGIASTPITTTPSNQKTKVLKATGSGFVVSRDGVIATNYHVVEDAKSVEICVLRNNVTSTYNAKILTTDKTNDIALLKIEDSSFIAYKSIPYSISIKTQDVGTNVFAMGYPRTQLLGEECKVTDGIINSKTGFQGDIVCYQISTNIAPGSSGGALFNQSGEIVGITSSGISKADVAQNVNYAIKSIYLYTIMEAAGVDIPQNNSISDLTFTDKVKVINPYIAYIKIY